MNGFRRSPGELLQRLKQVDHLRLPVKLDRERMLAAREEAMGLDYYPFRIPDYDTELAEGFTALEACGVLDYDADPSLAANYIELLGERGSTIRPTRVGAGLPATCALIDMLLEQPGRCRLNRLRAGRSVPFHSHFSRVKDPADVFAYDHFVIHLPLATAPAVKAHVRDTEPAKYRDRSAAVSTAHYPAGEVWLLNAWKPHAVFNESPADRIHLVCNFALFGGDKGSRRLNPRMHRMIEDALDA